MRLFYPKGDSINNLQWIRLREAKAPKFELFRDSLRRKSPPRHCFQVLGSLQRRRRVQIIQQDEAVKSAQQFYDLATVRYKTGLDPYLNIFTTHATLLSNQRIEIALRTQQLTQRAAH